jgi:predicted DCC family thiol-disulfide oxidoreductase YuxK
MTQIEKIAWLWNETNQFVDDFKASLRDPNRIMFVKAEDLFSGTEAVVRIFKLLQLEPLLEKKINRVMRRPVNAQRSGDFPKYQQWSSEQKAQLKKYAVLSAKYGYEL